MASYSEKAVVLFGPLGQKAGAQTVAENHDLFLSLNEEQALSAVVSYERLHMDELEVTNTLEGALVVHKETLGILLYTGKLVPQFSLSKRGKEQLDALTAAFRPAAEDPRITEYRQFNQNADAVDFQLRMASDQGFREWANATK
jgi:hypothetical protein